MHVSILAYDGCLGYEVFGLADVLLLANRISNVQRPAAAAPFEIDIIGSPGRTHARLAGGTCLAVRSPRARTDLVVVPAFDVSGLAEIEEALEALKDEIAFLARVAGKAPVAGVCGGSFLLAEAGLLNGRRAATAWIYEAHLSSRHPSVMVEHGAILVNDGRITTTGAFSAATDLALHLISDHVGAELARDVAKIGLLDAARFSQEPYIDTRLAPARGEKGFSSRVSTWLAARVSERYNLGSLAEAFHVSDRTLLRRFKAETGVTPLQKLQEMRIEQAKRYLETGGMNLAEIAERVGYRDLSSFSQLFTRIVSITPSAYRRRFGDRD